MHTEQQTAVLWCPIAKPRRSDDPCRCAASHCAVWRWGEEAPDIGERKTWTPLDDEEELAKGEPPRHNRKGEGLPEWTEWVPCVRIAPDGDWDGGYWVETQEHFDERTASLKVGRKGYCGLAGRPEVT